MSGAKDRSYHHGDLRRAIVDTAMSMLREDCGWQFTLREVARRAGVSNAAPYKHFPDKAALITEMSLIGFDRLRAALIEAQGKRTRSIRSELIAVARAYIAFGVANPALYRLMFGSDAGKTLDAHSNARALAALGVIIDLLKRGQEEGALKRRDLRGQGAACWAEVHGITMLTIDGLLLPEKVGPNPLDSALTTILEGLEK